MGIVLECAAERILWNAKGRATRPRFGDPQSLNLYTYVENNPIGKADSDGHSTCTQSGGGCSFDVSYNPQKETMTIVQTRNTIQSNSDGTTTVTTTKTSATFSTASNSAGQFLGATSQTSTATANLNNTGNGRARTPGLVSTADQVHQSYGGVETAGATQNISYADAVHTFTPATFDAVADYAARPDSAIGFAKAVGQDASQHPFKYAFYGVEAAAALTPLPEGYAVYEDAKAVGDVVVGAGHLAWDLAHEP
jgi:hypothetical protein